MIESTEKKSFLPAYGLAAATVLLTILFSPSIVGRIVSLRWVLFDLHTPLHVVQVLLVISAVVLVVRRHRISVRWREAVAAPRKFARKSLALGFSLVLGMALGEIVLRVLGLPFRVQESRSEHRLAQYDPDVGWVYIPNQTVTQKFGDAQREIAMHFDEIGSRVADAKHKRDPSAPTALLIGGSFTMGQGVTYEESLAGQLEATPDFEYQVVNLGVQAYGADQSLLLLERHFDRFNTKVVVYGFICDHVERDSVADRRLIRPYVPYHGTKPLFALDRNGVLYQKAKPRNTQDERYFRIWAALKVALAHYGPAPELKLSRSVVDRMRNFVESRDAVFLVVNWAFDEPEPVCGDEPFKGMALEVIDTSWDAPAGWESWRIPGDGHPDPRAHQRVASLIVERFRNSRLQANGPSTD